MASTISIHASNDKIEIRIEPERETNGWHYNAYIELRTEQDILNIFLRHAQIEEIHTALSDFLELESEEGTDDRPDGLARPHGFGEPYEPEDSDSYLVNPERGFAEQYVGRR
ncbi:MAG: hypothetical protein A2Z04_06750 [Chloroflexi bacterium RBG_16_57_9]|nr:MAG: hypothetical protein A2Z04_06750 [Chloroflexi bacterium RBG_16_57_9]